MNSKYLPLLATIVIFVLAYAGCTLQYPNMCGIVGIVGTQPVAGRLVDALKRLEYRGYDSAGVATIHAAKMR